MRTIALGFALFSMFFGAGNLVFPLVLGHAAGDHTPMAIVGLCLTGVLFPLIGLFAILALDGDKYAFFRPLGRWPGFILLLIVHLCLGPFGSIPRLFTLSHATLLPYLPVPLWGFSVIAAGVVVAFTLHKGKIIDILGYVLTPVLLLALGAIIVRGLIGHPEPVEQAPYFWPGMRLGYNTLDLTAALLFGRFVLGSLPKERRRTTFLRASVIATVLLATVYGSLAMIAAYHAHTLGDFTPEGLLSLIARTMLGKVGGMIASVAVVMACLTTAISLTVIFAEYLRCDLARNRIGERTSILLTLGLSAGVGMLGFTGVTRLLGPALEMSYPIVILLSVWHIARAAVVGARSGSRSSGQTAP